MFKIFQKNLILLQDILLFDFVHSSEPFKKVPFMIEKKTK